MEREKSEQNKVGIEGKGVASAQVERSETVPEKRAEASQNPLEVENKRGDHLGVQRNTLRELFCQQTFKTRTVSKR